MASIVSKPLIHGDDSGFEFAKEMLAGDSTAAINFDRVQYDKEKQCYIIFEYLLCDERQENVTPFTSHPKKYWNKNRRKFLALWKIAQDLKAILYLVNYAKINTEHQNKILLIEVLNMDESGILEENITEYTREDFSLFFRNLNKKCLE